MEKEIRWLNSLRVVILFLLLLPLLLVPFFPTPATAITDPDEISIAKVKVFNGVWEDGDWLFVCEYYVTYSGSSPAESPSDTYMAVVYNEFDNIMGSNGLNYYDHNVISVYFTSSQVAAHNMDWDEIGNYTFGIVGNPSYFPVMDCTDGSPTQNCAKRGIQGGTDDFDRGIARNRELLGDLVVDIAESLEEDWPVDLLGDYDRLNEAGSLVFKKAIPGLDQVVPWVFEVSLAVEEVAPLTKLIYLYPNGDSSIAITSVNPVVTGTTSHFIHLNWPTTKPSLTGTVNSGSTTAVVSDDFEQAQSFWVSATLEVFDTANGGPPQGESSIVRGFNSSSDTFFLQGTLTAAVQVGDKIKLDYDESYVYTTSTSIKQDLYTLENYDFTNYTEIQSVVIHCSFSSSGTGAVYVRPYIDLLGNEYVGSWRMSESDDWSTFGELMRQPNGDSWSEQDIQDLKIGIDVYTETSAYEVRVNRLYVEVVYSVPDFTGAYEKGLKDNMGDRLRNAFNNFGEYLGVSGSIIAAAGAMLIYFILAGKVFVATGNPHATIALTIPFILIGGLLGFISISTIFAIGFILIILFGIVFILGRFA